MNGSIYEYSLSSIPFVPGLNLLVKGVSWPTSFLANFFRPPGKYSCWARLQELIKCAPSKNPDTYSYLSNLQIAFVEESKSYPNLGLS